MDSEPFQKKHPLFLIRDILNSPNNAIEHSLKNESALRNYIIPEISKHYNSPTEIIDNMILLVSPKPNISQYEMTFVKIFKSTYPKRIAQVFDNINSIIDEISQIEPKPPDKTKLQRFCFIFVITNISEGCKQLLWMRHGEYVYYDNLKKNWQARWTGKQFKNGK